MGCEEIGTLITLLVGIQNDVVTLEKIGHYSKLKHKVTIWPSFNLGGIYPKEMKICSHKNLYANVHNSINYNSQKVKTIQMSIN